MGQKTTATLRAENRRNSYPSSSVSEDNNEDHQNVISFNCNIGVPNNWAEDFEIPWNTFPKDILKACEKKNN